MKILVILFALTGGCAAFPMPAPKAPALPLKRTAVIGASVSSGFCSTSFASKMREIAPDNAEILDASDLFFFESPRSRGREAVDRVVAFRPTFVVAVDYLFWFAYWDRDVSAGLAELERIEAPMVVGDIPWMGRAAQWILPAAPPPKRVLAELNERIRAWARARDNVVVVPLSAWVTVAYEGAAAPEPWRIGILPGSLMSIDSLHPNDDGADFLLARSLDFAAQREASTWQAR